MTMIKRRQLLIALSAAFVAIFAALWLRWKENKVTILSSKLNSTTSGSSKFGLPDDTPNGSKECSCSANLINQDPVKDFSLSSQLGLEGTVSDCCCSFSDIEQANLRTVHPLLERIVSTPFFSHFKINLCSTCQLWDDAPLCILRDCGVCECDKPPPWANENVDWMPNDAGPDCEHVEDKVETAVDTHVKHAWTENPTSFLDYGDPGSKDKDSMINDSNNDEDVGGAVVVDLKLNPEQYTGYSGESADKVWSAIHTVNCFQTTGDVINGTCTLTREQRVYNRIISGLHSSISLHIAHSYCLEIDPERTWECKTRGLNSALAHERVLDHPDRLENLYVAFAMTLRAVQKAGAAVTAAVPTEDSFFSDSLVEWTDALLPELTKLEQNCPITFDESSLFEKGDHDSKPKRLELQRRFRHLLQIMECVGCDRCKLWGTLQTLGIGTALRVLLDDYEVSEDTGLTLSRQEAVALVHTLERLSSALVYASELREDSPAIKSPV